MNIDRLTFVVFSDDWGGHPSSSQHLFRHIAADHQVLWVNTIGMRQPTMTFKDLRKALSKVANMLLGAKKVATSAHRPTNLHVCQPFMMPYSSIAAVRNFNRWSVLRAVKAQMRRMQLSQPVVVSTVPNACDVVNELGARRVIYYCVDDFAQWPGLDAQLVAGMEALLIARSDVLIATSSKLLAMLSAHGKSACLLTHGVDIDLFASETVSEHRCLAAIPSPRIGYYGLFDERSDQALLAELARLLSDYSFVVTGPVVTDVSLLRDCRNVYFTGAVDYRELPYLVHGLQALIIPYVVNSFTDAISPLKLKEYLVTGKPVISTPMAEALALKGELSIASTVEEWMHAIRQSASVNVGKRRQNIMANMRGESWSDKARRFMELCTDEPVVRA